MIQLVAGVVDGGGEVVVFLLEVHDPYESPQYWLSVEENKNNKRYEWYHGIHLAYIDNTIDREKFHI